ncbi:MAG: hypothetical protein QG602_3928, partial [Verrucomicrobiota bacterium]|nr:hypothetical protein [Verrucomicrobiota bacterium]
VVRTSRLECPHSGENAGADNDGRGIVVFAGCCSCAACATAVISFPYHASFLIPLRAYGAAPWAKGGRVRTFLPHPPAHSPAGRAAPVTDAGGVTREMVQNRTREMAVQAGRTPLQISQSDYERARIELTGETDMERQEAVLDAAPAGCAERQADDQNEGGWPFVLPPGTVLCKRPKNPSPNGSNCPPRAN